MALNPFGYGTPLSSFGTQIPFGSQQSPFGVSVAQQPVQQIVHLLQVVAQQQQQLLQIAHVQQHQLQYLQQIAQIVPQYLQQSQQPFGQLAGGAGFQGITPWTASPLSSVQASYLM